MPDIHINEFDDDSVRKIADHVRRLASQVHNLKHWVTRLNRLGRETDTLQIRTGQTAAWPEKCPQYPTSGCILPVQFADWDFPETCGACTNTAYPWPEKFVMARTYDGEYLPSGVDVLMVKVPARQGRRWIILPLPLQIIRFELTSDLCINGNASAKEIDCDLADKLKPAITVYDTVGEWQGRTGYHGWAVKLNDCASKWEIIYLEGPARFIEFTLTADMSGGQATANVDDFYGSPTNGKDPGPTLTVHDRQGLFGHALNGAKGFAVYDEKSEIDGCPLGKYIVWECDQMAFTLDCELSADMCSGDGSGSLVDPGNRMTFSPHGGQDPNPWPLSALNRYDLAGYSFYNVLVDWDETLDDWVITQIEHQVFNPICDLRYNAQTCAIEKQTQQIVAQSCEGKSQWQTAIQLYSQTYYDAFRVDDDDSTSPTGSEPGSCNLEGRKRTTCGFDDPQQQTDVWDVVLDFKAEQVLVDVYDPGSGDIMGTVVNVWTPCLEEEYDVPLIPTTDCETSSS